MGGRRRIRIRMPATKLIKWEGRQLYEEIILGSKWKRMKMGEERVE